MSGQDACCLPAADLDSAAELTVREMLCYTAELKRPPVVRPPAPSQRVERLHVAPHLLSCWRQETVPELVPSETGPQSAALARPVASTCNLTNEAAAAQRAGCVGVPGAQEAAGGRTAGGALPAGLRRYSPRRAGELQQSCQGSGAPVSAQAHSTLAAMQAQPQPRGPRVALPATAAVTLQLPGAAGARTACQTAVPHPRQRLLAAGSRRLQGPELAMRAWQAKSSVTAVAVVNKIVNIGVGLVAGPHVLFLDAPTSGLDSSSAHTVLGMCRVLVRP